MANGVRAAIIALAIASAVEGVASAASHKWTETIGSSGAKDAHDRARATEWDGWRGLPSKVASSNSGSLVQLSTPDSDRVTLSGGVFIMGSTATEMSVAVLMCRREVLRAECDEISPFFRAEGVAHEVRISPFAIDRHEVTVAQYRRCVASGTCASPGFLPGDSRFDRPDFPVVSVRWDDAANFCRWSGARLPTEAEWEMAAKGAGGPTGGGERLFPWGNVYNSHLANHGAFSLDETDGSDGFVGLAPVGSFPDGATPDGIFDLAGNAAEWVSDFWDVDENGFGYAPASVVDPQGPKTGAVHVIRGGSYGGASHDEFAYRSAAFLRTTARSVISEPRAMDVGFRCAIDAGPRATLVETSSPPVQPDTDESSSSSSKPRTKRTPRP